MNLTATPNDVWPQRWDIFCQVIDNYGDLGVCWRFCADLAERGHQIRLWVDDPGALSWMAPGASEGDVANVRVLPWDATERPADFAGSDIAHVWVEAFGCNIPQAFVDHWASRVKASSSCLEPPCWINLEYLSAEGYVERSHRLPSPVMRGPACGWLKHFYYPGFTSATGGLIREPGLDKRQQAFDRDAWLAGMGIHTSEETLISLFCYEPPALMAWLGELSRAPRKTRMLVTAGRATAWVISCLRSLPGPRPWGDQITDITEPRSTTTAIRHLTLGALTLSFLPLLTQHDFDHLLWCCDLNLVRGEDSLVRAIWARVPFLWQIYEQSDMAHVNKLMAFLQTTQADKNLVRQHLWWNNMDVGVSTPEERQQGIDIITEATSEGWRSWAANLGGQLCRQEDLVGGLLKFTASMRSQKQ